MFYNSTYSDYYNYGILNLAPLSEWNTSSAVDMSYMFYNCYSLSDINGISGWNTSKVEDMSYMFAYNSSLGDVNIPEWDLTSIKFNTSTQPYIRGISYMFSYSGLTSFNGKNWKTENLTTTEYMFYNCNNLVSVDLSNWNTISLTNARAMFGACPKLEVANLQGWVGNENYTLSCYEMFSGCSSLITVDIRNLFNYKLGGYRMFYNCKSLTTIYTTNPKPLSSNNYSGSNAFTGCTALPNHDVNQTSLNSKYSRPNFDNMTSGYFTWVPGEKYGKAVYNGEELKIYYDADSHKNDSLVTYILWDNTSVATDLDMYGKIGGTSKVTFDASCKDWTDLQSTANWFNGLPLLTEFSGSSNLNTSNVTNMSYMFKDCISLTDVSDITTNLDVANVTNMQGMFNACSKLKTIDISTWGISKPANLTKADNMFSACNLLENIYCAAGTQWSFSYSATSKDMFLGCAGLPGYSAFKVDGSQAKEYESYGGYFKVKPTIQIVQK